MQDAGSKSGRPMQKVVIADCGEYVWPYITQPKNLGSRTLRTLHKTFILHKDIWNDFTKNWRELERMPWTTRAYKNSIASWVRPVNNKISALRIIVIAFFSSNDPLYFPFKILFHHFLSDELRHFIMILILINIKAHLYFFAFKIRHTKELTVIFIPEEARKVSWSKLILIFHFHINQRLFNWR